MNRTGRNDLVTMKVAHDAKYLYFYAETREAITPHTDAHWMTLFIDADRNHDTGWEGYDYLINHDVQDDHVTVVESTKNGWNWEPALTKLGTGSNALAAHLTFVKNLQDSLTTGISNLVDADYYQNLVFLSLYYKF